MIKFRIFGVSFSISFLFLCLVSWFLVFDINNIALICLLSSLVHELSHVLFLTLFSAKINGISFKVFGKKKKKNKQLTFLKEFLVLISGCFSNLILVLVFLKLNNMYVVLVNLIILTFNLMPISVFDGGQILKLFLERFVGYEKSFKICLNISIAFCCFLLVFVLFVVFYTNDIKLLFIFLIYLLAFIFED